MARAGVRVPEGTMDTTRERTAGASPLPERTHWTDSIRWIALAIGGACLALLLAVGTLAHAASPEAAALAAQRAGMAARMAASPFGRPLVVDSVEDGERIGGTIRAELAHPFAPLAARLRAPAEWCAIVVLHLNVKACAHERTADGDVVAVRSGRKEYGAATHEIRYRFHVAAAAADFVRIVLVAPTGPLATRDYELTLEAAPVGDRTFVVLAYGFRPSAGSRMATAAYLATAGRGKPGFTVVGRDAAGGPVWIGGVRGIVERNAMRNFLALDAWAASLAAPAAGRFDRSVERMAALTDAYATQLAEMPAAEYVAIKRREWREHAPASAPPSPAVVAAAGA